MCAVLVWCLFVDFILKHKGIIVSILIGMHSNEIQLSGINQFAVLKAGTDKVLIDTLLLIRIILIIQFMFCLLQCIIQGTKSISWIIDCYDALCPIIIQTTIKLIKFTAITIDGTKISINTYQTIDIMTGYDDTLFFRMFSSYNAIVTQTGCFANVLMDCHSNMVLLCSLIQFISKVSVNLSLLIIFDAIYSITSTIYSIQSNQELL